MLAVEDEPDDIDLLSAALGDEFHVDAATSGKGALESVRNAEPPGVTLPDVMKPGIDGYASCRRPKANLRSRYVPVLCVTAHSAAVDEAAGAPI